MSKNLPKPIKDLICKVCHSIGCCEEHEKPVLKDPLLTDCEAKLEAYQGIEEEKQKLSLEKQSLLDENAQLKSQISSSFDESELFKKYPKANIEYIGRTFPTTKEMLPIDVTLLVTPQDYHIMDMIKKNGLFCDPKDYDKKIVEIYYFLYDKFYRYAFDNNVYGIPELWEFPFEIMEKKKKAPTQGFDCDSWAVLQASFYIAAGVPWHKVWIVAGDSLLGGHATVMVESSKSNKHYHLNSTYGHKFLKKEKLSDFPTRENAMDGTDLYGINNAWFSFNNKVSRAKFVTEAAEKSFMENGRDLFRIHPVV